MNKVCLMGRITADVELRVTGNDTTYARFTLAVNRKYQNENGERDADFISCVAWRERAELIAKYFSKGSQIGIEGHIQTGSYDKEDGTKGYMTDVIVDSVDFVGSKKTDDRPAPEEEPIEDSFEGIGTEVLTEDDDLPF
jgi:single-strand DNA-binding protein